MLQKCCSNQKIKPWTESLITSYCRGIYGGTAVSEKRALQNGFQPVTPRLAPPVQVQSYIKYHMLVVKEKCSQMIITIIIILIHGLEFFHIYICDLPHICGKGHLHCNKCISTLHKQETVYFRSIEKYTLADVYFIIHNKSKSVSKLERANLCQYVFHPREPTLQLNCQN